MSRNSQSDRPTPGQEASATCATPPSRWDNLPPWRGECRTYRAQVDTREIGYVNAILESYDNVARVQTEDVQRGILSIQVLEEWDDTFQTVMAALAKERNLKMLQEPQESNDAAFS